jgi:hypothetical protein
MNRTQPWIPLAWSCLCTVGCVVEGAPEELGVVQFDRGQPVAPRATGSVTGSASSNEPARDAKPTGPSMSGQMAPAAPGVSSAGAPATRPRAQDMAPTAPATSAAGSASMPVAGAGALAGSRAAAGAGGAGSGAPSSGEPSGATEPPPDSPAEPSGPGMLTVSFMSVGPGGRYAPRNCGAVWIEDASGKFVKTIERWTAIRERYLENWSMASGGWGFSIFGGSSGDNPDQVDVVTAGTLSRHQMHMSSWNMKNVDGEVVPDGMYTVVVEVSEGSSEVGRVDFVKGPMAQMLDGKSAVFSDMKVIYSR